MARYEYILFLILDEYNQCYCKFENFRENFI